MSIDLGLPTLPPPTLAPRRQTRKIRVGKVEAGGDAPVSVQSMTTTGGSAEPGRRGRVAGHRVQEPDPGDVDPLGRLESNDLYRRRESAQVARSVDPIRLF